MDFEAITIADLEKLSFIDSSALINGRALIFGPYLNKAREWEWWINSPNGLIKLAMVDLAQGYYLAESPARNSDPYSQFFSIFFKHLAFQDLLDGCLSILNSSDILITNAALIDHLHSTSQGGYESGLFVIPVLEQTLICCRRMFDQLQKKIIKCLWERYLYRLDGASRNNLPESFADMVLRKNQPQSAAQIVEYRGLLEPLAYFYERQRDFFLWLRNEIRNPLEHHGKTLGSIYTLEEGFAISKDTGLFQNLPIWNDGTTKKNLGSVRSLLAYVILNTLRAVEDLGETLSHISLKDLPQDLYPGLGVYIRFNHGETYREILFDYLGDGAWKALKETQQNDEA